MIGSPVAGPLQPHGAVWDGRSYIVVATFGQIDADHPTPHQGVDIGNGTCGFPILAVEHGTIGATFRDPINGALIIRYDLTRYPGLQAGVAHPDTFEVAVGQVVNRGDVIAHAGSSGGVACHLHQGMSHNGREIDWLPLLDPKESPMVARRPSGPVLGSFTFRGTGHALIDTSDTTRHITLWPGGGDTFPVYGASDLVTRQGDPVDIELHTPPLYGRNEVYEVWRPGLWGASCYVLRQDGDFTSLVPAAVAALTEKIDNARRALS